MCEARVGDTWYRYDDVLYASMLDEYDNAIGKARLSVELREYKVVKITPCGVQLGMWFGAKRFVRSDSKKRFAHPTKEAARESFIYRKERQAAIYQGRLEKAKRAIALARDL